MVKTRNKYFKLNTTLCFMQLELINNNINLMIKMINDQDHGEMVSQTLN